MNLTWCMIALAVAGADDQKFGTPPPSGVVPVVAQAEVKDAEKSEPWPVDLALATHIAFDNSEQFRVIELGVCGLNACFPLHNDGRLTIAGLNAHVPFARVKANAMALVRSVEREYWNLAQAQIAVEVTEQVVHRTEDLLNAEQAKLIGRASAATDAAEAAERLEQFSRELATRKADVMAAERSLRKVLGLPPADNRRIVATTKPIEELIAFDWDTCVEEMSREQPENIEQQAINRLAELNLFLARNQVVPLMDAATQRQFKGLGPLLGSAEAAALGQCLKAFDPQISASLCVEGIDPGGDVYVDSLTWHRYLNNMPPMSTRGRLSNTRLAQYTLLRTRARQRQVFEQTADSLSRCFVEVDDAFQKYTVARRLKAAAAHRLAVQRAFYEENRITIDRWLDAINQNAQAIATEARHQAAYNDALAALGEAKGSLLADRKITVADGPKRVRPIACKTAKALSIGREELSQINGPITAHEPVGER